MCRSTVEGKESRAIKELNPNLEFSYNFSQSYHSFWIVDFEPLHQPLVQLVVLQDVGDIVLIPGHGHKLLLELLDIADSL